MKFQIKNQTLLDFLTKSQISMIQMLQQYNDQHLKEEQKLL